MADQMNLSWDDDLGISDEEVTETDIKDAESMGKVPVGVYMCECVESIPKQKDFREYSCIAARLQWKILRTLELEGKPLADGDDDNYEGRLIFDDINMSSANEKDAMRKRRILVAKRTGLISDTSQAITKKMWQEDIIGKKVIITYIEESYLPPNTTVERKSRKVAFGGYAEASGVEPSAASTVNIDDI